MKKLLCLSLLATGLVLFAGCAFKYRYHHIKAHNQPKVDESEVCYLLVQGIYMITAVDGYTLDQDINYEEWHDYNPLRGTGGRVRPGLRIIEFLPGSHTISVMTILQLSGGYSAMTHLETLTFVGKAGHIYDTKPNRDWRGRIEASEIVERTGTKEGEKYILAPLREMKEQSKQSIIYKK